MTCARHMLRFAAISLTTLACASVASAQGPADAPAPAPASVDATGQASGGDIIVTATRHSATLNKVPISISAYSREELDSRGIRNFTDIVRQTPGVVFETSNTTTNIAIRGINSSVGAATTGIYIDDVPIQIRQLGYGGGNVYPLIFDLDRVEVLRGPQGTLFGAGSEGGTVRFLTAQPSLTDYQVYSRAELSSTAHGAANGEAGVALGVPIVTDTLGIKVSGYYRRDGGYVDRIDASTGAVIDKNANRDDSYAASAAVTWQPTPQLKITPSFLFQDVKAHDSGESWEAYSNYDAHIFRNGNPVREFSNDKFYLASLNVNYDLGGANLIGVGSYFDRIQKFRQDYTTFDQTLFTGVNALPLYPGQQAPADFEVDQKNWTGEIRLQSNRAESRFSWLVGGFYSHAAQTSIQQVVDPYLPLYLGFGTSPVPGFSVYDQNALSIDEQAAVFGQVSFKPIAKLTLTAGLRYSHTKFNIRDVAQGFVVGPVVDDRGSQSQNPLTPKFGVDFQATRDTLLYLSAARGFRVGGYNPQVGTFCGTELAAIGYPNGRPTTYAADSVWSYEAGAKSKFASGRASVQGSVYQVNWDHIQQPVALDCGFQFTSNLGRARSRGFDLQLQVKATDRLTVSTEVGYVDAVFLQTVRGGPTATAPFVTAGDHVLSPPWTVSLHGQYDLDLLGSHDAYIRSDFDFRSHQTSVPPYLDPANGAIDSALTLPPSVYFWSARLGVRHRGIDLSAFANNILDKSTWTRRERSLNPFDFFRRETLRPRTIGVTLAYRY